MSRQRCCLTPMVFDEDGRVFCLCCGATFRDPVTFADRASDTLVSVLAGIEREPAPRPETPAEITARVLAYIRANPSTHQPVRRGRPPKGAAR